MTAIIAFESFLSRMTNDHGKLKSCLHDINRLEVEGKPCLAQE